MKDDDKDLGQTKRKSLSLIPLVFFVYFVDQV